MPTSAISKLQPYRTMQLQGFDDYSSTALFHHASENGWTISGEWGSQLTSFTVLQLWDAQNQFEHPASRYLPDFAFDGVVLSWQETRTNCLPLDSTLYPAVTWPYLSVLTIDNTLQLVPLINYASPIDSYISASATFTLEGAPTVGNYIEVAWLSYHYYYVIAPGDTLVSAINNLGAAINADTTTNGVTASVIGTSLIITVGIGAAGAAWIGSNGNRLGIYATISTGASVDWVIPTVQCSGGVSPIVWQITLPFSSLVDINSISVPTTIQKLWLTYVPDWQIGEFIRGEFSIIATNWSVTDPNNRCSLKVAGEGSVRIEENDVWVGKNGYWENPAITSPIINPFWSKGFALRSAYSGSQPRSLTIETHCGNTHNIYVGTYFDNNCGQIQAVLDGGSTVTIDCYGAGILGRVLLFSNVSPGQHSVVIRILATKNPASSGWYFYFDFLDLAVLSDVPINSPITSLAVACDLDTDNTYKLSPGRLLWSIQNSGMVGEIDLYLGVFWWPSRIGSDYQYAEGTVAFSGTPTFGKTTVLTLAGTDVITHLNLITDSATSIATALALLVNSSTNSFRASATGTTLTLIATTPGSAGNSLAFTINTNDILFTTTVSGGTLSGGVEGNYGPDPAASPVINRATRDWLTDWFGLLKTANISCVCAVSQELVNPPASWMQRFYDGTSATTATGFGILSSTQCNFSSTVKTYIASVYGWLGIAMVGAGLIPKLQLGEIGWWFNAGGAPASMAYYDTDTTSAANISLGRSLHIFLTPNDNPFIPLYGFTDANFLRGYLESYVTDLQVLIKSICTSVVFELLWPLDVNDPNLKQLNYYINLPLSWQSQGGAGFTTFIIEGYQYAGVNQNLDEAKICMSYPFKVLGWNRESCRYLMGWYTAAWPWVLEYFASLTNQIPLLKLWAWDHYCLFGWQLPSSLINLEASATISTI